MSQGLGEVFFGRGAGSDLFAVGDFTAEIERDPVAFVKAGGDLDPLAIDEPERDFSTLRVLVQEIRRKLSARSRRGRP